MEKLTQERVKELLDYDPNTGLFRWKVPRGRCKVGDIAGTIRGDGYRNIMIDYKQYLASRLAWLYMEGHFPEYECDHENRVKDDNKWDNIRHVSRQCNNRNRGRLKNNTSGVTGIHWSQQRGHWIAQIMISGKTKFLGHFKDFTGAVKARWEAEVECDWPGCNDHTDAYCYLNQGV